MFPTGVGMNRYREEQTRADINVPHRRGDEPYAIPVEIAGS